MTVSMRMVLTRQAFAETGRTLIAKMPGRPNKAYFPKEDFKINLEAGTCTCLSGPGDPGPTAIEESS